jgi:hypothetical protein
MRTACRTFRLLLLLLFFPLTLQGVIERLYSLKEVLDECTDILAGTIEKVDRGNCIAVARIDRALKGTKEYASVQMNLGAGQAIEGRYIAELLQEGDAFVLFYSRKGDEIASLGHAGDLWFQLFATHDRNTSKVWWRFMHIEPYMGRTFSGTTPDLLRLAEDVLAGRRAPPGPDPKVPKFDLAKASPPRQHRAAGKTAPAAPPIPLIPRGAAWKYVKGTAAPDPGTDRRGWTSASFDDARWETGQAPFGYGDPPFGTTLDDMQRSGPRQGYSSIYLRGHFDVPEPAHVQGLVFDVDYDDGFILWLNGKRALAANAPEGEPAHNALAPGNHESGVYESFVLEEPERFLVKGNNVAALQVFNRDLTSSDLKIDLEATARVAASSGPGAFRQIFELATPAGREVRGISWADVDGDGRIDALFCRAAGNVLLLNDARGWREASQEIGPGEGSRSAGWADYDGDLRMDLLTSGFKLLHGEAGPMGAKDPLPAPDARNPEGAGWIDADGDGLPDVLITNGAHGVLLYRNTGKDVGRFIDVSSQAGLGAAGLGNGNGDFIACADFDGDGYTDFLYNLGGGLLARNKGGAFVLEPGTEIELPGGDGWKRGVAFADYDNDMDLDLFVPSPQRPRLYRNNNDGTFTDVLDRSGALAESDSPTFSCAWGDVDQDGFLDLFVCRAGAPGDLYLGDGRGRFREAGERLPAGWPPAFAASFADVDGDGDLDLAVNQERGVAIALNEVEKADGRAPVAVRVLARKGLIGGTVRAYGAAGRRLGLRQLALAESCGGQGPPVAHLALPSGDSKVTVCLSDGRMARRVIHVGKKALTVTFADADFEE